MTTMTTDEWDRFMAGGYHPVWREFAFRRIGAGDSVADFLRRFPASDRKEFGRYGVYHYYPGNAHVHLSYVHFCGLIRGKATKDTERGS